MNHAIVPAWGAGPSSRFHLHFNLATLGQSAGHCPFLYPQVGVSRFKRQVEGSADDRVLDSILAGTQGAGAMCDLSGCAAPRAVTRIRFQEA